MIDLATALALVLVLEGLLWAVSPDSMKRAAAMALGLGQRAAAHGRPARGRGRRVLVWLLRG